MKNLTDTPRDFNIEEIFNDIYNNKDYTTSLKLNKNELNILFGLEELVTIKDSLNNICIVNQFLPTYSIISYDNFYKYYTMSKNTLDCVSYITNDYPTSSWFPANHSNFDGPDGTIVFRDDMPLTTLSDITSMKTTAIGDWNGNNGSYYDYYEENQLELLNIQSYTPKTDGYKIVNNNITLNTLNKLVNGTYWLNKYGSIYSDPLIHQIKQQPPYDFPKNVTKQEEEGVYFQYKQFNTKQIIKDHKLLEYEIEYIFNDTRQINTLQGYIFNLKTAMNLTFQMTESRYWYGVGRDYFKATTFLELNPNSINENNSLTYDYNNTYVDYRNFSTVYLYVTGFDPEINEQVPMGYRSLKGPDFVDLEKMVPLIPKKISKIKLKVQQKLQFTSTEIPDSTRIDMDINKDIKGIRYYNSGSSSDHGFQCNLGDVQFDRFCGVTKFVPGFNVSLVTNNNSQYHTTFDTRNFVKFKSMEGQLLSNASYTGREILKLRDYYPYIYNINLNDNILSFKINKYCYKNNDILSDEALDSVDVQFITYDYKNLTTIYDSTVISSTNITNFNNIAQIDVS